MKLITILGILCFFFKSATFQAVPGVSPVPVTTVPEKPKELPIHDQKPGGTIWPGNYNGGNNQRNVLADWLVNGNWDTNFKPSEKQKSTEYPGYDGWYNNLARPDSGAIDRPLLRRWPAAYKDGTYLPAGFDRPNPLDLSDKLLGGRNGLKSKNGKSALLVFFGQQIVEEILDAQRPACPPEYINIDIPDNHTFRDKPGHTQMPVLRTRYDMRTGFSPNNPRQQLNEITPYIDGGLFYGTTKQWSDQLRTYSNKEMDKNGELASSRGGLFPEVNDNRLPMANPPPPFHHRDFILNHETKNVNRFFMLGNPRGNENAFLLTFGIMWFRWHNYLAKRIRHHQPSWSSEKVYNEARKWVIATQQQIYVYEWLPALFSETSEPVLDRYKRYDASIDPQIDQFFQSAAFRFGHTLVVSGVYLRDYVRNKCGTDFFSWKQKAIRTCNIFWRPQDPILSQAKNDSDELIDIDRILMGLSVQLSEQEDHTIVKDLRGNVFGPLEFSRRDLMAINIQRGRDHGLPDFNSARKAFGLDPYKDFEAFKSVTAETRKTLSDLYNHNINNIDVWIGGILETSNGPGELFREIIKDQFRRIRDGDRFWFENEKNGLFSKEEITRIKQIKIYDIIMAVTKMDGHDIPSMPFRVATKNSPNVLRTECHLNNTGDYYHLPPLSDEVLAEDCTKPGTYDFFQKSEASYILTFAAVGVFNIGVVGFAYFLIVHKEKAQTKSNAKENENRRKTFKNDPNSKVNWPLFIVTEWVGPKHPSREIILSFKANLKKICVTCFNGTTLRALDLSNTGITQVTIYNITDRCTLMLNTKHNYDLVVTFESEFLRNNFLSEFDKHFVQSQIVKKEVVNLNWNAALKIVVTKNDRQARLEMFFRVVFAQAFKINHSNTEILRVDAHVAKEVVDTELTITEFADSLSMVPGNEFVKRMFALIDKDKNGFISFREFVDLMIIFADGSEEQKAKLLFDMYDIDGVGHLKQEDFINMIKSFLETCGGKVDDKDIQRTVQSMLKNAGAEHKQKLTFEDFKKMIGDDIKNLNTARLGFKGIKEADHSYLAKAKDTIENIYESKQEIEARFKGQGVVPESEYRNSAKLIDENQEEFIKTHKNTVPDNKYTTALKFIELKSKEIFWLSLYTSIIWAIFIERAYYYSIEREHGGLRQIAGYGVTVTRGAASAMMFAYASLLVTMCRNMITYLRDTVANKYFPFDASLDFHKYIAIWGFIFSVAHIIGHAFNFYHITTQTADDLSCLFNNYFHATHELPKFHYWCWQTLTGFSGVIVTLLWIVMYSFALPIIRRKIYNWFWYTHNLYPYFYIFMILHGAGRLIQPPFFYYFFLAPVILFAIDTLISISRKKIEIPVIKAGILPSNVTTLEFRKPENFQYKAGQWVRIACMGLNKNEYHPFTLSSAPDEDNLTVHIRAVGPWTKLVRTIYENSISANQKLPKIYLDGPYGEGHQDWDTYDVAILVGGGIGVTPFASILKDVALRSSRYRTHCQKVYFIWVSRTQKQFEWLVDIIRDVENKDTKQLLSIHIFITQFYEKFDLRTILLYICERHYQRVSNKSLFTNLRAVTHFGRPAFAQFFKTIQYIHESAQRIGVFSCGPPSMTSAVDHACSKINQQSEQKFEHFFKNF